MKIDRKTASMLCCMPNDKMWSTVRLAASTAGIDLSRKRMTDGDINRLKTAISSLTDDDFNRISEILRIYKKGRKDF